MAFIPLPSGVRVVMEYNWAGELCVNVYHVVTTGPVVSANLDALATLFTEWWATGFTQPLNGFMSSDILLTSVSATDVSVADGEQFVIDQTTPIAGVVTQDSVPNNVAFVVSLKSTFTGRSRRGRNYYGGLPETLVVNNAVDAALATGILEAVVELMDELIANDYQLVVASYQSLGSPRVTALATPVTVAGADTVVDSQRRRLPGRGV